VNGTLNFRLALLEKLGGFFPAQETLDFNGRSILLILSGKESRPKKETDDNFGNPRTPIRYPNRVDCRHWITDAIAATESVSS
jgi:hypothetical protein